MPAIDTHSFLVERPAGKERVKKPLAPGSLAQFSRPTETPNQRRTKLPADRLTPVRLTPSSLTPISLVPLILTLAVTAPAAYGNSEGRADGATNKCAWEKLDMAATAKSADGKYKKALSLWRKALLKADDCPEKEKALCLLHAKMAQCYLQLEDFPACDEELKLAVDESKHLTTSNPAVDDLRAKLSKVYRSIDLTEIGSKVAADIFKKAGIDTIGISKLEHGDRRIELFLSEKFRKTIDRPPINKVMLDKLVSFDLIKGNDGTVQLNHIRGFLLRAKVWISIKRAIITTQTDQGEPTARVTAEKMGLTKTVTFKMPESMIDPLDTLVQKIKDFSDGTPRTASQPGAPHKFNLFSRTAKPPAPLLHSADVLKKPPSVVESLPKQ